MDVYQRLRRDTSQQWPQPKTRGWRAERGLIESRATHLRHDSLAIQGLCCKREP